MRSYKFGLLVLIIVANVLILRWRYDRNVAMAGVGPHVKALGREQADTVIGWRNAPTIALHQPKIQEFVGAIPWSNCYPLPSECRRVAAEAISTHEREALCAATSRLIEAYASNEPKQLCDAMLSLDEQLPDSSIALIKKLLHTGAGINTANLDGRSSTDLFQLLSKKIQYKSHWKSLVADGACIAAWQPPVGQAYVPENYPLGQHSADLFKNQTRYHHLFAPREPKNVAGEPTVADVRFVVNHDQSFMSEPSAYYIRFVQYKDEGRWSPIEMIHVATISGNSPVLLF